MKENLRRLQLLSHIFDMELFYNADVARDGIRLQGYFNSSLLKQLCTLKFVSDTTANPGFIYFRRNNITIILS
jgi:hypothetical protein